MTVYLLDTNVISDLIHNRTGPAALRLALVGEAEVCTSIVVAAEIRYGTAKRQSARLTRSVDQVLGAIPIIPFEEPADRIYGAIRTALKSAGEPIGYHDTLIAAHALALGCILVTDNESEFRRVPGLRVENWMRPS